MIILFNIQHQNISFWVLFLTWYGLVQVPLVGNPQVLWVGPTKNKNNTKRPLPGTQPDTDVPRFFSSSPPSSSFIQFFVRFTTEQVSTSIQNSEVY